MGIRALDTQASSRPAVFLDRDGVLNRALVREGKPYPPHSLHELEILPGVRQAASRLHQAGFLLIVVTNQPDVARGEQERSAVEAINEVLRAELPLDDIRVCYHDSADRCACRKPSPGLLIEAAADWAIDLTASYMVGDRWKDVEAGRRAGCRAVFIDYGYAEPSPVGPDWVAGSLSEATDWILGDKMTSTRGDIQ
jgi:D-glycero-D-manno-heptose 1,7-bisphosphate phosphatase